MRYFYTSMAISKVLQQPSLSMWIKRRSNTFIFWDCPVIRDYWNNVEKEMEETLKNIQIPSDTELSLFSKLSKKEERQVRRNS